MVEVRKSGGDTLEFHKVWPLNTGALVAIKTVMNNFSSIKECLVSVFFYINQFMPVQLGHVCNPCFGCKLNGAVLEKYIFSWFAYLSFHAKQL
jgi:hypothetical protein